MNRERKTTMARHFETSLVLASIHAFAGIRMAGTGKEFSVCFDELTGSAKEIAGLGEANLSHLGWSSLSQALRPVLKDVFSELSAEQFPDADYWKSHKDNSPEAFKSKLRNLGVWVKLIEAKYGTSLDVPDISEAVKRNLGPELSV